MPTDRDTWPQAMATVTECHYDVRAGRAMAFGLPSGTHFRIRYNYNADGQLHTGEFYSATAIPQDTLFPVRYNPDARQEHTHEDATATAAQNPRRAMLVVGIAGSAVLSLLWLLIFHGCN